MARSKAWWIVEMRGLKKACLKTSKIAVPKAWTAARIARSKARWMVETRGLKKAQ